MGLAMVICAAIGAGLIFAMLIFICWYAWHADDDIYRE